MFSSVLQRERNAFFIEIFSTCNAREPEVFADLILHIHTIEISSVVLNYVNLQRLQNWARSLPRTVFFLRAAPSKLLCLLPFRVELVMYCAVIGKEMFKPGKFGFIFSEILRYNIRQFIYKLPGLFN